MIIYAPAKINLVLQVLGKRPDGYHELFMLNEKLGLADELQIEVRSQKSEVGHQTSDIRHRVVVTCDDKSVPCDETNLCYRAARLVMQSCSHAVIRQRRKTARQQDSMTEIHIHITKHIPVAAGLGGGSSDAAAVLKGLNELLGLNLPRERLAEIGVRLGADVPFFLYDGPAICEGIGDKIAPLESLPNMWILLVNPSFPVSTKHVYEAYDKIADLQLTQANQGVRSSRRHFKGLTEVAEIVSNDLERVTLSEYPEVKQIKGLLVENGAIKSWMSGSGPTVVGMFESERVSDLAAERLKNPGWRVIKTSNCLGWR